MGVSHRLPGCWRIYQISVHSIGGEHLVASRSLDHTWGTRVVKVPKYLGNPGKLSLVERRGQDLHPKQVSHLGLHSTSSVDSLLVEEEEGVAGKE